MWSGHTGHFFGPPWTTYCHLMTLDFFTTGDMFVDTGHNESTMSSTRNPTLYRYDTNLTDYGKSHKEIVF